METNPNIQQDPPPVYGAVNGENQPPPVTNQPTAPAAIPNEPPPKYEAPKEGPYAQQQGGYYGDQDFPIQNQPTYVAGQPIGPYPAQGTPSYGTVQQTIVLNHAGYGPHPATIDCPNCHAFVTTQTSYAAGGLTWLSAGIICIFGCWAGCCLIPFCVPELQDVQHRCPNCGKHVSTYSRI